MLTAVAIKSFHPKEKKYKKADKDGLYLLIMPSGSKLWQFAYMYGEKEKTYSYGQYPEVGLEEVRGKHAEVRRLLRDGVDPNERKAQKKAEIKDSQITMRVVADEWIKSQIVAAKWIPSTAEKRTRDIERDILSVIGNTPVNKITTKILADVLMKIQARGASEVASRANDAVRRILRMAVQKGYIEFNPADNLRGLIVKPPTKHRPAVEQEEVGSLLVAVSHYADDYKADVLTQYGLQLSILTFLRSTELRFGRWSEIKWDANEWHIPAIRDEEQRNGGMKGRRMHIVPLARQSVELLKKIQALKLNDEIIFPSSRGYGKSVMSDGTMRRAFEKMGYKESQSLHGLRTIASRELEEMGFDSRLIELQLSHKDDDETRASYKGNNQTRLLLNPRAEMMQKWADWIDAQVELAKKI